MDKKPERDIPSMAVVFNEKGEILLSRRYKPGDWAHEKWNLPGGIIDYGENPKDTAVREVQEETGINVQIDFPLPIVESKALVDLNTDVIAIAYIGSYVSGVIDTDKDSGTSEAGWFSAEKIDYDNSMPLTKIIIDKALEIRNKYIQ